MFSKTKYIKTIILLMLENKTLLHENNSDILTFIEFGNWMFTGPFTDSVVKV